MKSGALLSMHLLALGLWGGVVAAEVVIELYARRVPEAHPFTVRTHYWIDLLVELPLLLAVLATGAALTWRFWPLTGWHAVKIGAGLAAVAANLACIALVLRRRVAHLRQDEEASLASSQRIFVSGVMGMPFAALAAALGL